MNTLIFRNTARGFALLALVGLIQLSACAAGNLGGAAGLSLNGDAALSLGASQQIHIQSAQDMCLDVAGGAQGNGALVQLAHCSSNAAQQFAMAASNTKVSVFGNKCLEIVPGAPTFGARVQIWDCDTNRPNQLFSFDGKQWTMGGLCLDVANDALVDGNPVILFPCNDKPNQAWTGLAAFSGAAPTATPASSGTYQKLVWSDEFDGQGAIDGSKWNTEVTCAPQNNENQCYTGDAQNLTQDGQGHLVVQANRQAGLANGKAFSSARINSAQKGDFTYGRVEARIKIPKGQGVWPAFWLMPTDSVYGAWPTSGELDIMEILGSNTNTLYGTAHYGLPQPYVQQQGQSNAADFSLDYHVYALERDAKQIRWYVDGQLFYTMNDNQTAFWPNNATQGADGSPWPFNQRFYVIFNLAMGGDWPGAVDGNINQATMLIDYVRIYN